MREGLFASQKESLGLVPESKKIWYFDEGIFDGKMTPDLVRIPVMSAVDEVLIIRSSFFMDKDCVGREQIDSFLVAFDPPVWFPMQR